MIEKNDALSGVERMVVRDRHHAGAEADALGALRDGDQKHFGRRDRLPSGGMMLADPEFVVAELVEPCGQFEVALKLKGRMLADGMVRCEKGAETKTSIHCGGISWREFI